MSQQPATLGDRLAGRPGGAGLFLASLVGRAWFAAARMTSRIETRGEEHLRRALDEHGSAILMCWHNRIPWLAVWAERHVVRRGRPMSALISASRDGDLATRIILDLGFWVSRGSSSRRGSLGFRDVLRQVRAGFVVVFVADGPRGPRYRAKPGVVEMARMTGVPVLPFTCSVSRAWILGSWDRLVLPIPGARGAVAFGEPVAVPRGADEPTKAGLLATIESRTMALTRALDGETGLWERARRFGRARHDPAGPPAAEDEPAAAGGDA